MTFLTLLFAEFARRYTGISFSFDLTPRSVDLVGGSINVAIPLISHYLMSNRAAHSSGDSLV